MFTESLRKIGLSEGEIKIYTTLLEHGLSPINQIHEKIGIERRNIYDILNKLIDKGLISYITEKRKRTYQCTNPSVILDTIKQRETALKRLEEQIPQVKQLYAEKKPQINVEIYRGNDSIKTLLNEILEYDKSFWIGGNSFEKYKVVPNNLQTYFQHWMKNRVRKKHLMHDLVSHGTHLKGLEPKNILTHKKNYYKYCQLPKGIYVPMVVIIFGDRVAQIQWDEQSFAVIIESKKIKESFFTYFSYFWKDPW